MFCINYNREQGGGGFNLASAAVSLQPAMDVIYIGLGVGGRGGISYYAPSCAFPNLGSAELPDVLKGTV